MGLACLGASLWGLAGCVPQAKPGFDSPAPSKRLDAIVNASALEDDESLLKLVDKLRSPDATERMFAIRSLEIRTGETLGYEHAAPHWQRVEAYGRWVRRLKERDILIPEHMRVKDDEQTEGHDENQDQPMNEDAG